MSFLNKTEICRLHFEEGIPQSVIRMMSICENPKTRKPVSYATLGKILGSNRFSLTSKVNETDLDVDKLNKCWLSTIREHEKNFYWSLWKHYVILLS